MLWESFCKNTLYEGRSECFWISIFIIMLLFIYFVITIVILFQSALYKLKSLTRIFAHFWLVLYNRVFPIRAMIFYDYVRELNASQADFQLNSVFSNHAPSITTIFNWFADFCREERHCLLKSYQTSGTVFTPENPTKVKIITLPHLPYSSEVATCTFCIS